MVFFANYHTNLARFIFVVLGRLLCTRLKHSITKLDHDNSFSNKKPLTRSPRSKSSRLKLNGDTTFADKCQRSNNLQEESFALDIKNTGEGAVAISAFPISLLQLLFFSQTTNLP